MTIYLKDFSFCSLKPHAHNLAWTNLSPLVTFSFKTHCKEIQSCPSLICSVKKPYILHWPSSTCLAFRILHLLFTRSVLWIWFSFCNASVSAGIFCSRNLDIWFVIFQNCRFVQGLRMVSLPDKFLIFHKWGFFPVVFAALFVISPDSHWSSSLTFYFILILGFNFLIYS